MNKNKDDINITKAGIVCIVGLILMYYGSHVKELGSKKTGYALMSIGLLICFINAVFWILKLFKK
ncbi:hypothetical protein [Tenacibaculum sp. SZ-18]|uniref:hypothetical protein n=1 Tax=Tenacibaculum sp. SZ-18 TaxID=754423 RepID=UPI0012FDC58D|nr:hypothetical protein [Tenacibaculum sp. SZ-18]